MATVNLTETNFAETVQENPIVLLDFWAAWCGPCRAFAPVYESVSEQHTDIVFGKIDTEAEQGLAGAAGITSIPTLMAIRDGIVIYAQPGAINESALNGVIQAVRDLDMDEVRASIAASSSPSAEHSEG